MLALKKAGRFVLKLVVTIAFLVLLARSIDFELVWLELRSARVDYLSIATGIFALQLLILFIRLFIIARIEGRPIPSATALRATMLGHSANQVLPSVIGGDAVRVVAITRAGISLVDAVRQIALDRLVGVAGLLVTVSALAPFALASLPQQLPAATTWLALGAFAGLLFVGIAACFLISRRPAFMRKGGLSRLFDLAEQVWQAIVQLAANKLGALAVVLLSLLGCATYSLVFWFAALSLGVQLDLTYTQFIIPITAIIMMLPISISGWGVREAVLATALGFVGIAPAQAVAASVLFGVIPLLFGLIGLPFLMRTDAHKRPTKSPPDSAARPASS